MHIKIKCVHPKSQEYYQNHSTFHEGDGGYDLFFLEDITIPGGSTLLIDLGVAIQGYNYQSLNMSKFRAKGLTSETNNPTSYWMIPRSSIYKTPLRMANSIGLVDAGYCNTLKAAVDNISDDDYTIAAGTRLFQIASPGLTSITTEIVKHLRDTERGEGGFGSTGV